MNLFFFFTGFTKEQLRVQLTRTRVLKISGTRPVGDNKWSSFQKDFPVSDNCETNKITAKFEEGILYVRQPKLIVPAENKQDNKVPTPHSQPPKIDQEQATKKTTTSHEHNTKHLAGVEGEAEKRAQNEQAKPKKDTERSSEPAGAGKEDRNYVPDKLTGGVDNTDGKGAARSRTSSDGNERGSYRNDDTAKVGGDSKLEGSNPAAKLKVARQTTMMVLAVLSAFALGMCVSYLRHWFSREAHN